MTNKELASLSYKIGSNEYAAAKHLFDTMKPIPIEIVCYLSQQAVEKSIKAILYRLEKDVLETHSIIKLLENVNEDDQLIHLNKRDAARITRFATRTRYAERRIDVTEEDAEFALRHANQVLSQAKQVLNAMQEDKTTEQSEKNSENRPDDGTDG